MVFLRKERSESQKKIDQKKYEVFKILLKIQDIYWYMSANVADLYWYVSANDEPLYPDITPRLSCVPKSKGMMQSS